MIITIDVDFAIGDFVYLKHDFDQKKYMVISYMIDKSSEPLYTLICGTTESRHYSFEITNEKDYATT